MPAFLQVEQLGVRLLMGFFFTGAVNIIGTSALVLATLSSEANTVCVDVSCQEKQGTWDS
jgi:hypothetical protein